MKKTAQEIIASLDLQQHPEGGWFKEVYRSEEVIKVAEAYEGDERNLATSINFLLSGEDISSWHKLKSD